MRFAYHYRQPFKRQLALCQAFQAGAAERGISVQAVEGFHRVEPGVDGLILFGIGGISRDVFDAYLDAGKHVVFVDKGYTSRAATYRVAVNAFQPVSFVSYATKPDDRWRALNVECKPYRIINDGYVLFDGASNKYCLFQRLGDWQSWGRDMQALIECHTPRRVIYRPRPSHNVRETLPPLSEHMQGARVVVSYGGNIGFDCVVQGVPHFAVGDSVARPLSRTQWSRLDTPLIPSEHERSQWLANVAYCQWSLDEIAKGDIWSHAMEQL